MRVQAFLVLPVCDVRTLVRGGTGTQQPIDIRGATGLHGAIVCIPHRDHRFDNPPGVDVAVHSLYQSVGTVKRRAMIFASATV